MLNTYNKVSISNHVNAVTGIIVKTYKDSYFERFHLRSPRSESLLSPNGNKVVIQMIVCGDMEVIAELMDKTKYEELLNNMEGKEDEQK